MKPALLLVISALICQVCTGQNSEPGGSLLIKPVDIYDNSFVYGEPIHLFFEFINNSKENAYLFMPYHTGKITIHSPHGSTVCRPFFMTSDGGIDFQNKMPETPGETLYPGTTRLEAFSNWLATSTITEPLVSPYNVPQDLNLFFRVFPVGQYRIEIEWYLYPTNEKVVYESTFNVKPLPVLEQEAFEEYRKAISYGLKSYFLGERNYFPSHPNSLESYLKRFPNSCFAAHAEYFLYRVVYAYPMTHVTDKNRHQAARDYIKRLPELENERIAMHLYSRFFTIKKSYLGMGSIEEVNAMLKRLTMKNPAYSRAILGSIKGIDGWEQLTNYAQQRVDAEQ